MAALDGTMTEQQFQDALVEAARLLGWRVGHFRPAQTEHGWRTAGAYDAQGFPDLVLVRDGDRVIFAELKSALGRLTRFQSAWIATLAGAGAEVYVWRPADFDAAVAILSRRGRPQEEAGVG